MLTEKEYNKLIVPIAKKNRYRTRAIGDGTIGIICREGKHFEGSITAYDLEGEKVILCTEFSTRRRMTAYRKRLQEAGLEFEIGLDVERECDIIFSIKDLEKYADVMLVRKKRTYSADSLRKKVETLQRAREERKRILQRETSLL